MAQILTRQAFELIAHVIREARTPRGLPSYAAPLTRTQKTVVQAWSACLESLAKDFANELASTNGRFDKDKFLAACEPEGDYTNRSRKTPPRRPVRATGLSANTRPTSPPPAGWDSVNGGEESSDE